MGAITLDLRPGLGVGPFTQSPSGCPSPMRLCRLSGSRISATFSTYFDEEPLNLDFVISFPDHGFHLCFDPWSQRLRLVEIYDVKRLKLRYATPLIGGPSTLATFAAVYAIFGPTFPRIYDKDRGIYTLFYPGLSFAFPIPSQYTNLFTNGEEAPPRRNL